MDIRDYLNERPGVAAAVCGALMLGVAGFVVWWLVPRTPQEPQPQAYFYDLNTGELFEKPADTVVPFKTKSGNYEKDGIPAGVLANVYCCGPYRQGTEKFVGYLEISFDALPEEKWPPGFELDPETEPPEIWIRRETDDRWYDPDSPEGLQIMGELGQRCKDKRLNFLRPLPK
jgi:hypothetical protein